MSKPLFTTKHYKVIAKIFEVTGSIKKMRASTWAMASIFADVFQKDNPKFDSKRFLNSCGVNMVEINLN